MEKSDKGRTVCLIASHSGCPGKKDSAGSVCVKVFDYFWYWLKKVSWEGDRKMVVIVS